MRGTIYFILEPLELYRGVGTLDGFGGWWPAFFFVLKEAKLYINKMEGISTRCTKALQIIKQAKINRGL
jgi:hypothetical protein